MAADFKIVRTGVNNQTETLEKASATVIEAGDMVALDAGGLAIKATAASTAIAFTEGGAGDGDLTIEVVADPDLVLKGTGDAVFAESMRGTEVDLVINGTNQQIDVGASVTDVLKIAAGEEAGTVASTDGIVVKINKPLF